MTALTDDVGFLLTRASGLAVRATNAALADVGLRVRQYSVLVLADDAQDGISQRDLAEVLGLDPSQVVALVDELAAAGLGVVLISSELAEVVEGASRVLVLRDGHVVDVLTGDGIGEHQIMNAIAGASDEPGPAGDG